jgi:L-arabinose isomerase
MDAWLTHGGTHHMVMNLGHHASDWRDFCRITDIELVTV